MERSSKKITLIIVLISIGIISILLIGSFLLKKPPMPKELKEFKVAESEITTQEKITYQLQLVMTEGIFFDEEFAGSGGGIYPENYQGNYELRLFQKGKKNAIDRRPINEDFAESAKLNFAGIFDIVWEDYNADGQQDFTIGQYGSSSMNLYCLYSIDKEEKIEKLVKEPIAQTEKKFSVAFEKAEDTAFYQKIWDNALGIELKNIYKWNAQSRVFEEQSQEQSEEQREKKAEEKSSSITLEELKQIQKITDYSKWGEIIFLEQIEDADITLYGICLANDYYGVILREGDSKQFFPWNYMTPRMIMPKLYQADYDGDGEKEIAVDLYTGSGTGVAIEELYILERKEDGSYKPYAFEAEDYVEQMKELTQKEEEELYFGSIVEFSLEEGLQLNIAGFDAKKDFIGAEPKYFTADILYKDGKFALQNVKNK